MTTKIKRRALCAISNMRVTITLAIVLTLLTSCDSKQTPKMSVKMDSIASSEIQVLIQDILDLPKLQWIYHPEVADRLPVKLLQSGLVTKDLKLRKFDNDVLILTQNELVVNKMTDYVFVEKLLFKGDTLSFSLTYDVEGAFADGKFARINGKWTILNYEVGER